MKKKIFLLSAGALLLMGGPSVYATTNGKEELKNNLNYRIEEVPTSVRTTRSRSFYKDIDSQNRYPDDFLEENEDRFYDRGNHGMMGPRKNQRFGFGCDFHR